MESEEHDFTPITDEPEEDFRDLAEAALHNAGIDANQRIWAALDAGTGQQAPAVIEPENIKIVYKVMFDLPDAGLPMANDPNLILGDQHNNTIIPAFVADDTDDQPSTSRYPTRARRSVIGSKPYDAYAPRMAFLHLGTM